MARASAILVEAARTGDESAITKLLEICQPDIRRFARRTCATSEDVEDAVQVALWQLYRRIGALKTAAAFTTWLFRIVERECYRLFRGRSEEIGSTGRSQAEEVAPRVPVDLRLDLIRAIGGLSEPYREVLILRDIDELTAAEVAVELGLSLEAVKSRLLRARASVRARLWQAGIGPRMVVWSTHLSISNVLGSKNLIHTGG